jgi:hypothetical protein
MVKMFRQCVTKSHLHFHSFKRAVKWFESSKNVFTARKSHYWSGFEENTKFCQIVEVEQCHVIKFFSDEGMPGVQIIARLREHYGEGAPSQTQAYFWVTIFLGQLSNFWPVQTPMQRHSFPFLMGNQPWSILWQVGLVTGVPYRFLTRLEAQVAPNDLT